MVTVYVDEWIYTYSTSYIFPHFSHLGSYLDEGRYQLLNPSIGKDIRGMHKGDDCCRDAG